MPKPVYIICCQFCSEDRTSGLLSLFGVLDAIHIDKVGTEASSGGGLMIVRSSPFRVVAVWAKADDETETEYESETRVIFPPEENEWVAQAGPVAFIGNRLSFVIELTRLPFQGPGVLRVENRIRRADSAEWSSQSCTLDLILGEDLRDE